MSSTKVTKKEGRKRLPSTFSELTSRHAEVARLPELWKSVLKNRSRVRSLRRLAKEDLVHPLAWGMDTAGGVPSPEFSFWEPSRRKGTRHEWSRGGDDRLRHIDRWLEDWLHDGDIPVHSARDAMACLTACHAMTSRHLPISDTTREQCLKRLIHVVEDAQSVQASDVDLESQLLAAELPITLAYLYGAVESIASLGRQGIEYFQESLDEFIDDEGLLVGALAERLVPLLACWTRCLLMIDASNQMKVGKGTRRRYSSFAIYVVRLMDRQCKLPFEPPLPKDFIRARRAMLKSIPSLIQSRSKRQIVEQAGSKGGIASGSHPRVRMIAGDDGTSALLQSDWQSSRGSLYLDFSRSAMRMHIACQSDVILSGLWHPTITIDGLAVDLRAPWRVLFQHSDRDIDLIELEAELTGPWRLQRQFMLAKDDGFLFLADLVYGPTNASMEYALPLPIPQETSFRATGEARECELRSHRYLARLVPLAASEWRMEPSSCRLETDPGCLIVRRDAPVQRLYAPLFVDLNRRRRTHELTWRRLAVAENLQRVSDETAVGYRIQVGAEQWLIYRSFTRVGNRTLLGQNLSSEFFCGRFLTDGTTESLIEVEVDPLRPTGTPDEGSNDACVT